MYNIRVNKLEGFINEITESEFKSFGECTQSHGYNIPNKNPFIGIPNELSKLDSYKILEDLEQKDTVIYQYATVIQIRISKNGQSAI